MSNDISDPLQQLRASFLAFLRHAVAAQQKGQAEARSIRLQAAAHLHAPDDVAVSTLVSSLSGEGRHNEALELAGLLAQLQPDDAASSFRFGLALQLATRHHDAIAPYRRVLTIDPDFPKLRNNLAAALKISGGDAAEELALLDSAVKAHPQDGDAWTNLGQARRERMDLDGALDASARAVELAPRNPLARNNHALILREVQRWDDAQRAARCVVSLQSGDGASGARPLRGRMAAA
jgi:tetratricopeptide (TPR) repeat protein